MQDSKEPVLVASDEPKKKVTNVIRYHLEGDSHSLDSFTDNIDDGLKALKTFDDAVTSGTLNGKKIRACGLIVGGQFEGSGTYGPSVTGGQQIAAWSSAGGLSAAEGWRDQVSGLPRASIAPRSAPVPPAEPDKVPATEPE